MKKIMVIALALIMMLSCIACANNAADNNAANGSDETPVLKVALSPDFAPMEFVDTAKEGQDQFVGFDVTLAKHIAEQLGMKLEIEPMSFDACQVAVQMGNVDLGISGFSWTAERAENYLISDYYIAGDNETKQTIIVAADKAGQYTKAEDFAGMKIGAQAASLQEQLCNEALPEDTTVELFKDINVAVVALQTGKVDGVAVADGNAEAIMANNQDIGKSGFFPFTYVCTVFFDRKFVKIRCSLKDLCISLLGSLFFGLRNGFLRYIIYKSQNKSGNQCYGKKDCRILYHIFHACSPPLPNGFGMVIFSIRGTRRLPRIMA